MLSKYMFIALRLPSAAYARPPVKELSTPSRIGAAVCARSAGAATFDASATPAPAEYLMNVRRETRAANEPCFFIASLPGRHDLMPAAAIILGGSGRQSLGRFGWVDRWR